MLLSFLQHSKSATYSVGMQKTYSLICLAMEEDKIDQTKKAPLKLPFLSWGTKNRQKAASTLCLPSAVAGSSQVKKKLSPFTLLNTESSLYWIFQKDLKHDVLTWCVPFECILKILINFISIYTCAWSQTNATDFTYCALSHYEGQGLAKTVKLMYWRLAWSDLGGMQ